MKENNLLVSVIVPCYNHEKYIEECILSIINQTYKNIEIIVIDDGSTDNSSVILKELSLKYSFYFEIQENQGVSRTLNKCLSYTNSDLVVAISSDDMLMPNAINDFLLKYIELEGKFSVIFGDSFLIDNTSKIIQVNQARNIAKENEDLVFSTFVDFFKYHRKELLNSKYIGSYQSLLEGNYISVGIMFNKHVLLDVGAWNENLKLEDYELWLKMSKVFKIEYTNTIVSKYRFHDQNSYKSYKDILAINVAEILITEKQFIQQFDIRNTWNIAYNNNLLGFLKYKKYKLFFKYYQFSSDFFYYLFNKILKKLLRFS